MKARSCWNFPLPKRSSIAGIRRRRSTERKRRHSGARVDNHCCAALQAGVDTELAMEDLWRLSAKDIAALIRSKKVSAKEAATAALARLDAVNPAINAVVDHRPADVLEEAAAIDAAIMRGEHIGPLAGGPGPVKGKLPHPGFAPTHGPQLPRAGH